MSYTAANLDILDAHIGVVDVRNLRRVDRTLLLFTLMLVAVGFLTLYSAGATGETWPFAKQAAWFGIAAVAAVVYGCVDYRFLVSLAPALYVFSLSLLVIVLLFGVEIRGSKSWFQLGPFRYQPSEFSKVALVCMLAWYLSRAGNKIRKLRYFLLAFVIAGVPCLLIRLQQDTGTALTLPPIVFVMLYAAGCKRWHLAVVIILGLGALPVAWNRLDEDNYQKERVRAFLNPNPKTDRMAGWHTLQTKITVGSGRFRGKGFRQGTQTHLKFLPEHHTDFIFSLLAEETGFVGAVSLLALVALFLYRGLMLAHECPDLSGSLLAVGLVTVLAFHVFVNIAVTLGLLPVLGIPLPFMSYGGSFYMTTMLCVGALLSTGIKRGMFSNR